MTRILLATDSADLQERFHHATGGAFLPVPLPSLPAAPDGVLAHLNGAPLPDVLVLDPGTELDHGLELALQFEREYPGIAVVLVNEAEQEIGLAALRAGVRDVLHPTADVPAIQTVLERASATIQPGTVTPVAPSQERSRAGRVISVVSPKGGVGKTTLATNIAVGLAKIEPGSTVIVDLDVQFGDVATALNLSPEYSLMDTVRGPASQDTMALKTFLTLHQTGLYAICAPDSPADADTITGDEVGHLLTMLASQFRFVVVDTAPGLGEHTLTALDAATDLVLITSMDVLGVRGLRKELDTLARLELDAETRRVVLNMCDPRGGLTVADVAATIGTAVDLELPVSAAVLPSLNQGIPVLQKGGRDVVVKRLEQLVASFASPAVPNDSRGRHVRGSRLRKATAR